MSVSVLQQTIADLDATWQKKLTAQERFATEANYQHGKEIKILHGHACTCALSIGGGGGVSLSCLTGYSLCR